MHAHTSFLALFRQSQDAVADLAKACRISIQTRSAKWAAAGPAAGGPAATGSQDDQVMYAILEQLKDPLLPVRAHALMDLRRLVLTKVCCGGNRRRSIATLLPLAASPRPPPFDHPTLVAAPRSPHSPHRRAKR